MTAALEGGEWSAARPSRTLPLEKTRYPFYRRLGGPHGRSGQAENLVPTGIRSHTVQPAAQSLYRLSYQAHTRHNIFYLKNIRNTLPINSGVYLPIHVAPHPTRRQQSVFSKKLPSLYGTSFLTVPASIIQLESYAGGSQPTGRASHTPQVASGLIKRGTVVLQDGGWGMRLITPSP